MCVVCDSGESLADTVHRFRFPAPSPVSRRRVMIGSAPWPTASPAQGLSYSALARDAVLKRGNCTVDMVG